MTSMPDSGSPSDALEPLLAASANGDEAAFARLYALSSPKLFAIVLRILQRRDWAEEALQDVYVRVWQKADTYSIDRGAPMAWLATIARYRALDLLRGRRPEVNESSLDESQAALVEGVESGASPEDQAAEHTDIGRLDDCLKVLPAEQRKVVLLSYYEGFSHSELAKKLATPLGTIKSWTRRGLLQLRECLGAAA